MAPKNKGKKGKKGDDDFWYEKLQTISPFNAHNILFLTKGIRLRQITISLAAYQVKMETIHQALYREFLASLPLLQLA